MGFSLFCIQLCIYYYSQYSVPNIAIIFFVDRYKLKSNTWITFRTYATYSAFAYA